MHGRSLAGNVNISETNPPGRVCWVYLKMDQYELKAKEIINNIYQKLGLLNCMVSSDIMWRWSKDISRENIKLIKEQIPMYTGNLNPKWKYWDDVEKAIERIN